MSAAKPYELFLFQDASSLAQHVAERWFHTLLKHDSQKRYCIALSGGRVAMDLFEAMAEGAEAHRALLEPVHFFWGDERCVAPGSPESNFKAASQIFLKPAAIPESRIHRIRGEDAPEFAIRKAEDELREITGDTSGVPVLDLVLLGMGEDGHVASLFPGESEAAMSRPDVFRSVIAAKPPPQRITLGYGTLAAAREVWVLASGKGKVSALRESVTPTGTTPLARVIRLRKSTTIFTDIALE